MVAHTLHLAKMAASTSSSKQMVNALEKILTEKQTEILHLKESVKTREDLLELASKKNEKLADDLSASKSKNKVEKKLKDEEAKSAEVERKHVSEIKKLSDKVAYVESEEYTAKVLDIF